ncbi:MAG: ATP-binding protein [Rikenellaceae bacterium]|nr:ATP-binding protein [Rikenellaceae bacterium]MCL2693049.1 ATP-binding protein [Rikenellaceae bacterium]
MNDLSLHIIDILQNSIVAGATLVTLTVEENTAADRLRIVIEDNGRGMTAEQVTRLADPFFTSRTTRKVGMGIPLFRQTAEQSGGSLSVSSTPGVGTTVEAKFSLSHIDRPPLGALANSFILTATGHPSTEFILNYIYNDREYRFDTREVKEALDGLPLGLPQVVVMLDEMVRENIDELKKGFE